MIEEKYISQEPLKTIQLEKNKKEINELIQEAQTREFAFNGKFS